ncbi:MAG: hypothetical protein EOO80_05550, partial [Oxalobacteraceae bacterium]
QFTQADLLAQLRLAGEMHATGPARRTALLLGASDTRAARRPGRMHLAGQAQLGQQVGLGKLSGLGQLAHQRRAGVAVLWRIVEQRARLGRHPLALDGARQQGVALDLVIVFLDEQGQLAVEIDPVALAAELEQPVVAHAVGDGTAFIALQEIEHFGVAGVAQARFEPIIVDIRGNRVVRQPRGESGRAVGVALAGGVAQLQEDIVLFAAGIVCHQ